MINLSYDIKIQVKVKLTLCLTKNHAKKTYGWYKYSSTHTEPRHWMEVNGLLHAPVASSPAKRPTGYTFYRRLGGA
jgi:hypothetical protein